MRNCSKLLASLEKAGQWHMKVALTARPSNHGCQLISHQTSSCTAGFHWDCTKTSIRNTNTNTQVCFFQSPKSCSHCRLTWGGGMSWLLGTEIIIENIVCKHFFVVCFFPSSWLSSHCDHYRGTTSTIHVFSQSPATLPRNANRCKLEINFIVLKVIITIVIIIFVVIFNILFMEFPPWKEEDRKVSVTRC